MNHPQTAEQINIHQVGKLHYAVVSNNAAVPQDRKCKTCKWWERVEDRAMGFCRNPKLNFRVEIDRVFANADTIPLGTHVDFGCIHHES